MSDCRSWPPGFLWGVSTSGHQYDGNNVASDYWALEHLAVPLFTESSGDALNSYHLWPRDMALAAELGFTAYRFGIEWARIEPARGCFSVAERDRYQGMIDACRRQGLEPVVTLHHITHPAWFTRGGGWTAPDAVDRFTGYVDFVAPALSGVRWVSTINEPNYLATLAGLGQFLHTDDPASLYRSMAQHPGGVLGAATTATPADEVVEALIRAHRAGRDVLHEQCDAAVGWTVATQAFEPVPGFEATWAYYAEAWEDRFLRVCRDDDWVGVQSYTSQRIGPNGPVPPRADHELTQMGWEFRPDALGTSVRRAAAVAPGVPIIVTENGIPTSDDTRRVAFINGAIEALHAALTEGVEVRGYCHWSFIDNFEWTLGYAPTFGLVAVDRHTFIRTPKPSARHLGALARQASVDPGRRA
jgi:beta-glucosidase